jgi:hypothetical protein
VRCYLPSTGTVLLVIVIVAAAFHGPVGHAAATVGVVTAILAITALVAGILTGTTLAARAIRRRRAAAGGCVTCQFKCQQAPAARRPLLVGIYTRQPEGPRWPHEPLRLSATRTAEHQERTRADGELIAG